MSWGVVINKDSFKELRSNLKSLGGNVDYAMQYAVEEASLRTHDQAVRSAPVDTGRLKSSIRVLVSKVGKITGTVWTDVFYGVYVELGTRRSKAKPFMGPAYEANAKAFPEYAKQGMAEAIKRSIK